MNNTPEIKVPSSTKQSATARKNAKAIEAKNRFIVTGSIIKVAQELGISRQRVHQIILTGVKRGLFPSPFRRTSNALSKFDGAILTATSLTDLRLRLGLTPSRFDSFLVSLHYDKETMQARIDENRQDRRNSTLMRSLRPFLTADGALPTTTTLQSTKLGRSVYVKLIREYGSYTRVRAVARRYLGA